VASTSQPAAVRAVLDMVFGPGSASGFELFCGDQVSAKKPAPDIYLLALEGLGVGPGEAVAVEDSRQGLQAAQAAGIPTLVTVSSYTIDEDMSGAAVVVSDLGEPDAPMTVIANQAGVRLGRYVRAADLALLTGGRRPLRGGRTSHVGSDVVAHAPAGDVEREPQPDPVAAERDA